MKHVRDVFEITRGHGIDLCYLTETRDGQGIPYISRSEKNNGIVSRVMVETLITPAPANVLTVALGGSVLATFLQTEPFYTSQNVDILKPLRPMTTQQLVWYATAIRANRYRFSYGRHANKELKNLILPDPPTWVEHTNIPDFTHLAAAAGPKVALPPIAQWRSFCLLELGFFKKGERFRSEDMETGDTPFIGATEYNNGMTGRCEPTGRELHPPGCITISYDGSIGRAFYQTEAFLASDSVNVFYPKTGLAEACIFLCLVLSLERFRYNYGRKWHLERMQKTVIRLPVTAASIPDYDLMARYVMGCNFSASLSQE